MSIDQLQDPRSRRESSRAFLILSIFALAHCVLLLVFTYPPVQDYPNHLLRQEILREPSIAPYSEYLDLADGFRPNLLADWLLSLFTPVVSATAAGKALLCLEQLLLCGSVAVFLSTFGSTVVAAVLAGHLIGSWVFLKGLINFGFGLGLGLLWLSWLFGSSRRDVRYWLIGALLGTATVATHGFAFLAFSAVIVATSAVRLPLRGNLALVPASTVLPGLILFLGFLVQRARSAGLIENELVYSSGPRALFLYNPVVIWLRGSGRLDVLFGRFGWTLIGLAWIWAVFVLWRRLSVAEKLTSITVPMFSACSILLYLVLPDALTSGWGFIKYRVAAILFLVSLPLLSWLPSRFRRTVSVVAIAGAIVGFVLSVRDYRRFDGEVSTYMKMAEMVPVNSVVLSVNLKDPPGESLRPYQHVWAYMCLLRSCLSQEVFAEEYAHPISFKRELAGRGVVVPPYDWSQVLAALQSGDYAAMVAVGRLDFSQLAAVPSWYVGVRNPSGSVVLPRDGSGSE